MTVAEMIGLGLTALTGLSGAAWWMSALYSTVKGIKRAITDLSTQIHEATMESRAESSKLWAAHVEHEKALHNHDVRLVKLETTTK